MYAYVMRPETLPHSYWQFIVKSGPVAAVVLEAVRRNNRGLPVDVDAVNRCACGVGEGLAECGRQVLRQRRGLGRRMISTEPLSGQHDVAS